MNLRKKRFFEEFNVELERFGVPIASPYNIQDTAWDFIENNKVPVENFSAVSDQFELTSDNDFTFVFKRKTKKEDLEKKKEHVERLKNWLFISNNESFKDFAIQMNEITDEIFGELKKEIEGE